MVNCFHISVQYFLILSFFESDNFIAIVMQSASKVNEFEIENGQTEKGRESKK